MTNQQLTLDFATADARQDDTPFADWLRSFPPTPWTPNNEETSDE